jgi:hypothetical protein
MTILFAVAALLQPAGSPPPADEIVVVAGRRSCRVKHGERPLSDRELDALAGEWAAGRPVRVVTDPAARIVCLAKIAFKLADRGVRFIEFVDRPQPKD